MDIPAEPHFPTISRCRRAPRSASSRHRNYSVPVGRVRRHCTTPFLPWKFNDALSLEGERACGAMSSRKLAASLWRLRLSGSDCEPGNRLGTRMKVVDDKEVNVYGLQAQLFRAQQRIHELESEHKLYRKHIVRLLHQLGEEKASAERREREKLALLIDNLRIEKLNSSLVSEVANAKVQAKKVMQDYEEVKKGRALMEGICKEMAKEMGEDKAKMGAWVEEALKYQREVEEERKMLEIANAWREERVEMKLADAKVAVEDKYGEMNKLVKELEAFLQMKSKPRGATELRRVSLIRHAVRSVNIEDIKQLSLVSESDDTSSITQDIRQST